MAIGQVSDSNYLNWSDVTKLTYRNYRNIIKPDSFYDAQKNILGFAGTAVNINKDYVVNKDSLEFDIYAYVDLRRSYITPDTFLGHWLQYILTHEQDHFDLSEIYARKMRRFLINCRCNCDENKIDKVIDSLEADHWETQKYYDLVTLANEIEQDKWNKKIARELASLSRYKSVKGKIYCKQK